MPPKVRPQPGEAEHTSSSPGQLDLPEQVRSSCARVASAARWVQLDEARLTSYAAELADEAVEAPDVPREWTEGSSESRAGLVLTSAAVNYGSGWHPVLRKAPGLSGARTVAAALTSWWSGRGGISPGELRHIDPDDVAVILGQDGSGEAGQLMRLYATGLEQLGAWVEEQHAGSWLAVVEAAKGSAARLAGLLAELPQWQDRASHPACGQVWFAKRAQLAAGDLALAGLAAFDDVDRLTVMADNLVPHVLRLDGLLQVDPRLLARIEAGDLLQPGEEGEVELRALAVHAGERLVDVLARHGHSITAAELDRRLWWRGRLPRYKARPRHRTRSTWY